MNKFFPFQKLSRRVLLSCAAFGFGISASAQTILISTTVQDGGFESITGKANFPVTTSATSAVPYWGATGVTVTGAAATGTQDTGAQLDNGPGSGTGYTSRSGPGAGSYYKPGDTTAFNLVTTRPIALGDVFTLSWYARTDIAAAPGVQTITLFTGTYTGSATYTYAGLTPATVATAAGATNPTYSLATSTTTDYQLFTLSYSATAADVGKYIGLTAGNAAAPNTFISMDDFNLSVTNVPEPSTYAVALVGLGALAFVTRVRRAAV